LEVAGKRIVYGLQNLSSPADLYQIDGPISLTDSVDQLARFKAHGWNAVHVDGHDQKAVAEAIKQAQLSDRPSMIACKTTIGFGAPNKAGTSKAHGEPLGAEELAGAKKALGWNYGPFEVPDDVLQAWRNVGAKAQARMPTGAAASMPSPRRCATNLSGA
jgi:transketolase